MTRGGFEGRVLTLWMPGPKAGLELRSCLSSEM